MCSSLGCTDVISQIGCPPSLGRRRMCRHARTQPSSQGTLERHVFGSSQSSVARLSACMMWAWPACTGCSGITSSCDRYPQPWPTSCTGCNLFFVRQADVVIVVAGMDGALPGVVGGLVSVPVIAVPTSIGYGASFEVHFLCCILSFRCNVSYCWC